MADRGVANFHVCQQERPDKGRMQALAGVWLKIKDVVRRLAYICDLATSII